MHSFHIAFEELLLMGRSRRMRIAAFGILIIPLLYGALYLWAFWDPYAKLDKIPVALVNQDVPARVDGTTIDAGADLADELVDEGTLDWSLTDQASAAKGLHDGTYYFALRIPSDFSSSLASADGDSPVPARLLFTTHEATGMIANQIGDRVMAEVRAATSRSVSEGYYDDIFLGFEDLSQELTDAADGATELHDGLAEARDGADLLADGAASAHDGAGRLAKGSAALAHGAARIDTGTAKVARGTAGLSAGLATADDGARALVKGSSVAAAGARDLASGSATLAHGAAALADSAHTLAAGAQKVSHGLDAAAPALTSAASGASQVAAGAEGVVAALDAYVASHPDAASDPALAKAVGAAAQVKAGSGSVAKGLEDAGASVAALTTGATQVSVGAAALAQGADSLATGAEKAAAGASSLADGVGDISAGQGRLAAGIGAATSGARTLSEGTRSLAKGARELDTGATELAAGASELNAGLGRLSKGSTSLATGLEPAVEGSLELADGLTAGVAEVPRYTNSQRDAHAAMMSDPVDLKKQRVDSVPNYGTGFAPYFIPLALWIGALATFFVVRPVPPAAIEKRLPPFVAALAGLWPAALLAIAQSSILVTVLHTSLGLTPRSLPLLFGYAALTSVVFVALLQWLSAAFGLPGKFIAIVLLMLQLTSAAGTYPLETLPSFFQRISPWLPMTYVVAGLRQIISGGNWRLLEADAVRLAAFGVLALLLMTITAWRARFWPAEKLNSLPDV